MEIKSILLDQRIESFNVLIDLSIGDYLAFAINVIDNNEYQRRKVIKAKIREILKEDLQKGCLIPSIVLATYGKSVQPGDFSAIPSNAQAIINSAIKNKEILIIDGLQRTYVMLALKEELESKNNKEALQRFLAQIIRAEVYIGLKRIGLLYRMITLNTGQTTMSTRHLMEILYHDYTGFDFEEITLIQDRDGRVPANNINEYSFKDILDGFNSLIEKDEGLINRTEILDNIKSLDVLKDEVSTDKDLFKEFTMSFRHFLLTISNKSENWSLNPENFQISGIELKSSPFGKNVIDVFKRSQVLTGYGAAIGQLRETRALTFDILNEYIERLETSNNDWQYTFTSMLAHLDIINNRSKKIGNDQRYYFRIFYRSLFNEESDQFLNILKAADNASNRTREERLPL